MDKALHVTPPTRGIRLAGNASAQKVRLPKGYERCYLRVKASGKAFNVRFQMATEHAVAADITAAAIQDSTITSDRAAENGAFASEIFASTFEDFDPATLNPKANEYLWVSYINADATGAKLEIVPTSGTDRGV